MQEKLAGVNSIMEALRGERRVHKIYIQEGRGGKRIDELKNLAARRGVFCQYVEKNKLDRMYTQANHQGVVAQVDVYEYSTLEEILEYAAIRGEAALILLLDGIEDPQNLGSIIRSAECAGVHGIVIPRHNAAGITPAVARASAGAVEHMRVAMETNLVSCINRLKDYGLWIVAADMDGSQYYYNTDIPSPTAVVLGGEGQGIRRLVKQKCDLVVKIPMFGTLNSLNVSAAATVLIYEILRQRRVKTGLIK